MARLVFRLLTIAPLLVTMNAVAIAQKVQTDAGLVEGFTSSVRGVRAYLGIPFAAPPVGDFRWREPQPVKPWSDVLRADHFGPRCMQAHPFKDMVFRDTGPSEDCLYLNVWTPAGAPDARLPVMIWIFGGGYQAGGTSEPRQDGAQLASNGVVVVSMNYRLGIFGFFAHPELTRESPHGASGNYGLMDQIAAAEWVKRNIAAFGGDPGNVTIFGESAGSFSVSALVASPVAAGLFQRALGESGAITDPSGGPLRMPSLSVAEQEGESFGQAIGATSLAALRQLSAADLLAASIKQRGLFGFRADVDGYVVPENPLVLYQQGRQNRVPLLVGWNAADGASPALMAKGPLGTPAAFRKMAMTEFGTEAREFLRLYPAGGIAETRRSAAAFTSANFIVLGTWTWANLQQQAGLPVFRYHFEQVRPNAPSDTELFGHPSSVLGARHASEIEYVFGTLDMEKDVPWRPQDRKLSKVMQSYWTNFARNGDPNGSGLPRWPTYDPQTHFQVMHLGPRLYVGPEQQRRRFEFLKSYYEQHPRPALVPAAGRAPANPPRPAAPPRQSH
jgi:para-nitrobenzyl esterase